MAADSRVSAIKAVLAGNQPVLQQLLSMLVHELVGKVEDRDVKMSVWPTATRDDRVLALSGADIVAILCNVQSLDSVRTAENTLLHEVRSALSRTPVLLVGVLAEEPTPDAPVLLSPEQGRQMAIRMQSSGYFFLDLAHDDQSFSAAFALFSELARIGICYKDSPAVLVDAFTLNFAQVCEPLRRAYYCTYYNSDKTLGRDKGHLYVTNGSACFHHIGTVRADVKIIIPFAEITTIKQATVGLRGRKSIEFDCASKQYSFAGFDDPDVVYQQIASLWHQFKTHEHYHSLSVDATKPNPFIA